MSTTSYADQPIAAETIWLCAEDKARAKAATLYPAGAERDRAEKRLTTKYFMEMTSHWSAQ